MCYVSGCGSECSECMACMPKHNTGRRRRRQNHHHYSTADKRHSPTYYPYMLHA